MYEVVWDTTKFNDRSIWPADGSQPFYLSTGDNTGLGQHADYVFGWKGDSLQRAMDTSGCMGARCANLQTQAIDPAKKCQVAKTVDEDEEGCKFISPTLGCAQSLSDVTLTHQIGLDHLPGMEMPMAM